MVEIIPSWKDLWIIVQHIANSNHPWFPPKLGFFVDRFIDVTKLCSIGKGDTQMSQMCLTLMSFAENNINDIIKMVYHRWVVYDYVIVTIAVTWSFMQNNLNNQARWLIGTSFMGHIVQACVHAYAVRRVTSCNHKKCSWTVNELEPYHAMATIIFGVIFMVCLRFNTSNQQTIAKVERLNTSHGKTTVTVMELQNEARMNADIVNKLQAELAETRQEVETLKVLNKDLQNRFQQFGSAIIQQHVIANTRSKSRPRRLKDLDGQE